MHKQKKNLSQFSPCQGRVRPAFTLVELIVVITILAILGTISFISLQGYSTDARDSTRISDLSTIRSSLELYQLDSGKYPLPTNGVSVTYSGSVVWKQGTFGETVYANLAKLDKIPKDALTDKEYTYSVINKQNEYELAGLLEGDTISLNPSQPSLKLGNEQNKANAGTVEAKAYTTGNYNGTMAKSLSGTTCSMIGVPTIIANDVSTTTDLSQIVTNKGLVYNGYKNLPSSFKESKFKHDGGFDFTTTSLIAYTDTGSCEALTATTNSGTTARVALLKGLQDTYSGTLVQNEGEIQNIVALTINTSSPSSEVIAYGANFVNNTLGGNIIVNAGTSSSTPIIPTPTECTTGMTELTLTNGQTWSCLNLGATEVRDGTTQPSNCGGSGTNCNSGLAWLGNYYQWGRNDTGFTSNLINPDSSWGGGVTSNPAIQGPCQSGWHVPTNDEWISACDNILGATCNFGMTYNPIIASKLKLPSAGYRKYDDGTYLYMPNLAYFWTSTPVASSNFAFTFNFSGSDYANTLYFPYNSIMRSFATNIRCIKN